EDKITILSDRLRWHGVFLAIKSSCGTWFLVGEYSQCGELLFTAPCNWKQYLGAGVRISPFPQPVLKKYN
ncbi:hypothetical protein P7M10_24460, partial [Vibrio parahaemolyticus]|nr:hypothetical protein [Vibrio parahaemolyticus]